MSKATKRKHVNAEVVKDDYGLPTPNQSIVRILGSRGNNLHEVQSTDGSTYLVSMPTKFRRNVWVKRGDYVLVEPITEGDKVKAEIARVLTAEYIKYYKKDNVWPAEFDKKCSGDSEDVFVNTNRQVIEDGDSSDTSDDD